MRRQQRAERQFAFLAVDRLFSPDDQLATVPFPTDDREPTVVPRLDGRIPPERIADLCEQERHVLEPSGLAERVDPREDR